MSHHADQWSEAKRLLTLAVSALALLAMLACGGSSEQPLSSPTEQSVLFATPPPATAPGADDRPDPGIVVQIDPTATPYTTATPYPTSTPYPTPTAWDQPPVSGTPSAPTQPVVTGPTSTPSGAGGTVSDKADLKYPNVGSALNDIIARVEAGEISAEDAAAQAPLHRGDAVAVTIYLSGNVEGVVSFLESRGVVPRNVGEDYIEAFIPILLLPETSRQPGVLTVRVVILLNRFTISQASKAMGLVCTTRLPGTRLGIPAAKSRWALSTPVSRVSAISWGPSFRSLYAFFVVRPSTTSPQRRWRTAKMGKSTGRQ